MKKKYNSTFEKSRAKKQYKIMKYGVIGERRVPLKKYKI